MFWFFSMKIKSNFNIAFDFHERSMQRLSVKSTHTFYSLLLYPNNCCKYLCSMSRLSQISLNQGKIRNVCAKNLSVKLKSVAKRLFDSVLAKNQIFLNETDGRRLKIKL